jgi:GTP cyclohydrolase I
MRAILESQSLAGADLQELMREMLVRLGEDPERDGLRETPERMERSMQYLTKGYQDNPEEILLGAMFDVAYDEMVIVKDIEMFSLCEHHLLPFFGKVHVAYIPRGKLLLKNYVFVTNALICKTVTKFRRSFTNSL